MNLRRKGMLATQWSSFQTTSIVARMQTQAENKGSDVPL